MPTFNWAIVGIGWVAGQFAADLKRLPRARLHAVVSTSDHHGPEEFMRQHDVPHGYRSIGEMLSARDDLDVVYIATPHVAHHDNTLVCLERGLAVLCEKPFSLTAAEAQRMADKAREKHVFLMEALWTLFIPAFRKARELVEQGAIGELHTVKADFGFKNEFDPESRYYKKELGGGSLLDLGAYPAMLCSLLFGKPAREDIVAAATFASTGVDESCAFTFRYPGPRNRLGIGYSTLLSYALNEALLLGTEGAIRLHSQWTHPQKLTLTRYAGWDQRHEDIDLPFEGEGFHFEAEHVMDCLAAGKTQSDVAPLDFSVQLMHTLDRIRRKIGLAYENELED